MAYLRSNAPTMPSAAFTIGSLVGASRTVEISRLPGNIPCDVWLSTIALGGVVDSPPNGGTRFSAGLLVSGLSGDCAWRVVTTSAGTLTLSLSDTSGATFFVNVAPSARPPSASEAVVFV